jgi:hypothetical protein
MEGKMFSITNEELKKAAIPLIKLINEKCHPNVSVIVTPSSVELLERFMADPTITEFVKD